MTPIVQRGNSLSFWGKISRLATRLSEPKWQRYGAQCLPAKWAGVGCCRLSPSTPQENDVVLKKRLFGA
jgi:hypothetical protein